MSTLPVQVIGTSRIVAPDEAVSLVRVYIEDSHPEAPSEAWTDPDGHFTLMAPMDEDFDLLVQRPGCEDHTARNVRWSVSTPPPIRIPACVPVPGAGPVRDPRPNRPLRPAKTACSIVAGTSEAMGTLTAPSPVQRV